MVAPPAPLVRAAIAALAVGSMGLSTQVRGSSRPWDARLSLAARSELNDDRAYRSSSRLTLDFSRAEGPVDHYRVVAREPSPSRETSASSGPRAASSPPTESGYLDDFVMLSPTGDAGLQVMYTAMTDGRIAPFATMAVLLNP